jgi:hypothetical protein
MIGAEVFQRAYALERKRFHVVVQRFECSRRRYRAPGESGAAAVVDAADYVAVGWCSSQLARFLERLARLASNGRR